MKSEQIAIFRDLVNFSLDQVSVFLKLKYENYKNNETIKNSKPLVYRENLAVLEEEQVYISHTKKYIESFHQKENFDSVEEYKNDLLKNILKYYEEHGVSRDCHVIITEKIQNCWEFYNKQFPI